MFVLGVVVLLSGAAGIAAAAAVRRWPNADPASSATFAVRDGVRWRGVRRFLRARTDPAAATGLALSIAFVGVVAAGLILGLVVYMVRTGSGVVRIDQGVARWAATHVGGATFGVLRALTLLGSTLVVVGLSVACAVYGWRRRPGTAVLAFLAVVVLGQFVLSNLIKYSVDRVRPSIGPFGALGTPSFPSGHSTAATATFAAIALVIGRDRSPRTRAILAGGAVSIAVAVGCSRALLGVHWFSDVVCGLILGWTWFAVCAVAFGGRLLWFGAPIEAAQIGTVGARAS